MSTFCSACGSSLTAEDRFCRVCGRVVSAFPGAPAAESSAISSGPAQTSGKAIASLICGLLFFVPLAFVAAIVFGHLGLSEIRRSAGRLKGEGMAIAGLVLGYMWVVGIPIFLILAAIAIPNFLRARVAANEASAMASVRTLVTAEVTYADRHRDTGYTCSLPDLRRDGLINPMLASGQRSGYAFELLNCQPGAGDGPSTKFQVVAYPIRPNTTGTRAFCSDESGVVKVNSGGSTQECRENGVVLQ